MEYYATSTASESASDTTDSIFLDLNQYISSDRFNLGMIPTVDTLEAYCDYGDLGEFSFEPYMATASAPTTERHLGRSVSPIERMQPGAGLSFSTNGEFFLGENPTVTVQHTVSDKTDKAASEEELRNLARQKRRLRNRVTAARSREKKKAQMEALQQRVETLLKRQSELEKQVHVFQQNIKSLTLQNKMITQENARLCLEINKVTWGWDAQ
ncbi:hypothetical protein GQ44DRAFT_771066 [Phaeosphaeriaceae sp. PMI808]|nr:hypothetical protein GQ44DRAFT_771066 [Phaeosphaeriaceae sp. PMI808]